MKFQDVIIKILIWSDFFASDANFRNKLYEICAFIICIFDFQRWRNILKIIIYLVISLFFLELYKYCVYGDVCYMYKMGGYGRHEELNLILQLLFLQSGQNSALSWIIVVQISPVCMWSPNFSASCFVLLCFLFCFEGYFLFFVA